MSLNLEDIILDFLSNNELIRKKADVKLTNYFNFMQINELSNFYSILKTSSNNNVKMYISIFIKNFIEQKINAENRDKFIEYINKFKYDILNIFLSSNLENKTINLLVLSLCKGLSFLQIDMKNYTQTVYELSSFILQFYINQRNSPNKDVNLILKSLFICSKFNKYIDKEINKLKYRNAFSIDKSEKNEENENNIDKENTKFELLNVNFYNTIVEDYSSLYKSIFNSNNSLNEIGNNKYLIEYLILYIKIFKYSLNYLEKNNREKILDINYNIIAIIFNQIINNTNNLLSNSFLIKSYIDIISLSNRIINKYLSSHVFNITLNTIKNYLSFFYSCISNEKLFSSLSTFFRVNEKDNRNSKEIEFILDIINFLYTLIELIYINFPEYKIVSKKNNISDFKEIVEYINKEFLSKDKIKSLIYFIIKKCLVFSEYEIFSAQEDYENFYLNFTEISSLYDIKTKSGALCNLIYTIFRKKYIDIFQEFENNLISLTIKENELFKVNQILSGDELNIKCALLLFFYYLDDYFNLNNDKDEEKICKIFLEQINVDIIKRKGREIFSSFIIIKLLTKIVSNNFGKNNFKRKIIEKITNIFFSNELKETLIELSCFDLFNEYTDMQPMLYNDKINKHNGNIFPEFFIQNYLVKITQMINKISSPELHSKIIETTNNIINYINKEKIVLDFNLIIPSLEIIWQNKNIHNNNNLKINEENYFIQLSQKNTETKNKNKIYMVRRDLIKLMNIIITKIGFYTYNKKNKEENNNFLLFHNFIYQIINYSLNCNQSEEIDYLYCEIYNLMILIQDNYAESISLSSYNDINNIKNLCIIISNDNNFLLFSKFFEFFNKILEQSSNINNNQYFISQLFIIEQFMSFCFIPKINNFIENENFIDKVIYILNNMLAKILNDYYQYIFNIMEYFLYMINTFSNFSVDNKNKYTDFIYQFIMKILKGIELSKSNFEIYFGAIQLANRLIYVNACKNIISDEFNKQIANAIISFYKFYQVKKNEVNINFVQKNILQNSLSNLLKIFNINNNINNNEIDIKSAIKQIYNDVKINNKHPSNYDSTSSHWLFFFNKITNDLYFYKLNSEEDKLRFKLTELLGNKQIFFSVNKEFAIKYFFLKIDPMINGNE